MKANAVRTIVVYTGKSGFTGRYARWTAEPLITCIKQQSPCY